MIYPLIAIPARHACCRSCRLSFEGGAHLISILLEEEERYLRVDLCPSCYAAERSSLPSSPISIWHNSFPPEESKETLPLSKQEALFALLRRFLEEDPPSAYLLALTLHRQGFLHKCGSRRGGSTRLIIFERGESGEGFAIPECRDPELLSAREAAVKEQLAPIVLDHDAPRIACAH